MADRWESEGVGEIDRRGVLGVIANGILGLAEIDRIGGPEVQLPQELIARADPDPVGASVLTLVTGLGKPRVAETQHRAQSAVPGHQLVRKVVRIGEVGLVARIGPHRNCSNGGS